MGLGWVGVVSPRPNWLTATGRRRCRRRRRRRRPQEPYVFGKSLNLTAIAVLCGLVFWGWIWGIPGAV